MILQVLISEIEHAVLETVVKVQSNLVQATPGFSDVFPCTDSSTQKMHWIQRPPALRRPTFSVPSAILDLHTATKSAILAGRVDCNRVEVCCEASACSQQK